MSSIYKVSFIAVALLVFVASVGLAESPSSSPQALDGDALAISGSDASVSSFAVPVSRIDAFAASSSSERSQRDASGGDSVRTDFDTANCTDEMYVIVVCCLLVSVLILLLALVVSSVEKARRDDDGHWTPWPRAVYIVVWLIGMMLSWVAWFNLYPQSREPSAILAGALPWQALWTTLVFVIWFEFGDKSGVYVESFKPYRSIWIGFALAILTVFLVCYASIGQIKEVSRDLRGAHVLGELDKSVSKLSKEITATQTSTPLITDTLRSLSARSQEIDQLTELLWRFVPVETGDSWPIAVSIPTTSTAGIASWFMAASGITTDTAKIGLITIREPLGVSHITSDTVKIMAKTSESISSIIASLSRNPVTVTDLKDDIEQLDRHVRLMEWLVAAERKRMDALDSDFFAPFNVVSVLLAVVLLFPWIVLLLFLLCKSEYLTRRKYEWLRSLDLLDMVGDGVATQPSPVFCLVGKVFVMPPKSGTPKVPSDYKDEDWEVAIRGMTFRNSEYVIGLVVLTGLGAVMWYLFFYPLATAGLIQLTTRGGGLYAFADYLSGSRTPLMAGYLGAYIFLVLLLLRRYFAKDVTPKVYVFAVTRVIMVLVLGAVLPLVTGLLGWSGSWTALIAFAFGVFPVEGLQWILQLVRDRLGWLNGSDLVDKHPLTRLDGINLWHEERLSEESIDNIQNLANANIGQLILHLNYSPERLLDWVDQAVLYNYAKDAWYPWFEAVGIRTATALVGWEYNQPVLAKAIIAAAKAAKPAAPGDEKAAAAQKLTNTDEIMAILQVMIGSIRENPNIPMLLKDYRRKLHEPCPWSARTDGDWRQM